MAAGIFLAIVTVAGKNLSKDAAALRQSTQTDSLAEMLRTSAASSIAIYTPSLCGGPAAAPHGDGTKCPQVRFYGKDAKGTAYYWGWEFVAAQKIVKECLAYTSADGQCKQYGNSLLGMQNFSATPTTVDQLPLTTQLAYVPVSKEIEMRDTAAGDDPQGRVVAGNRVTIVNLANNFSNRQIHLLQGGAPFSTALLGGTYTPPAIGTLVVNPNPVNFNAPNSPAQIAIGTETGYSKYTADLPGPYWSVTPCVDTTNAAQQDATVTLPGAGNTGGSADTQSITVTPTNNGTCKFTVTTLDQSVVVTVQVSPLWTYLLTVTGPTAPYLLIGQNTTFTATATLQPPPAGSPGYSGAPPPTIPVGITANTGTCADTPTGFQPSGSTFTVTSGAIYETCTLTVSGNPPAGPPGSTIINNNEVLTIGVYQAAAYALVVSQPAPGIITIGQPSSITATALITNAASAPPASPPSVPITQSVNFDTASVCHFSSGTGSTYTYIGDANGTCDITFNAPLATPASITVAVGVGQQACVPPLVGIYPNCQQPNPCLVIRPTPNWYILTPGTGTASPAWPDMMQAIANQDAIDSPGVVPNNNILYGFADNWPSTGNSIVKGAILMAQNTDCSISIMWPTASQKIQDSNMYREFRWDMPGAWGPSPTGAPYAPWIDASNQGMGEFETLCYGIGGTFDPQCPQPGGTSVVDGSSTDSFMHPQENRAVIANWDPGTTQLFKLKPDPSITVLPIPQIGHHIYNLTGNQQNYWQEGADWMNNDGSVATQFCLILACP